MPPGGEQSLLRRFTNSNRWDRPKSQRNIRDVSSIPYILYVVSGINNRSRRIFYGLILPISSASVIHTRYYIGNMKRLLLIGIFSPHHPPIKIKTDNNRIIDYISKQKYNNYYSSAALWCNHFPLLICCTLHNSATN